MALLSVERVCKAYKKKVPVLENICLSVVEGEIVGLIGESGSGKSTLARIIMQLEPTQSGTIRFNGKVVEQSGLGEFYADCQIVFQNASAALNPSWTVQKILYESIPKNKDRDTVIKRMLKKVKLKENLLTSRPAELSGGEKQRVNLLRAILVEPKLLICDEIVSGLDRIVQKEIIDLLIELNQELDMAILFISHDLQIINYFCERTYVMKKGKIVDQAQKINGRFDFMDAYAKKLIAAAERN